MAASTPKHKVTLSKIGFKGIELVWNNKKAWFSFQPLQKKEETVVIQPDTSTCRVMDCISNQMKLVYKHIGYLPLILDEDQVRDIVSPQIPVRMQIIIHFIERYNVMIQREEFIGYKKRNKTFINFNQYNANNNILLYLFSHSLIF